MTRHEREVRTITWAPDGTVTAVEAWEAIEDAPARPALSGPRQTEAARRTPYVIGAVAMLCVSLSASVVGVAMAVLP